ncbi:PREDICTED: uncharacterized protein LOC109193019 [Ipomoea nil]|uniref:uncharacterized protein LOC109193019 n=1 Tax=Ipomoea nil TaxID=35883 RepID=UPI0009012A26|nr:PREDICTED: uncharacterized protein LOC109193019 [Ipomoea nil]
MEKDPEVDGKATFELTSHLYHPLIFNHGKRLVTVFKHLVEEEEQQQNSYQAILVKLVGQLASSFCQSCLLPFLSLSRSTMSNIDLLTARITRRVFPLIKVVLV